KPVVGYMFTRVRARAIDEELGVRLPCRSALEAHRKLQTLVRASAASSTLRAAFGKAGIAVDLQHWAYQQVIDDVPPMTAAAPGMLKCAMRLAEALETHPELSEALEIDPDDLGWIDTAVGDGVLLSRLCKFVADHKKMRECFVSLPEFDYVGEKSRLES